MELAATDDRIRRVLGEYAQLAVAVSTLANDDDLFDAGMTSHASIEVMFALENEFGVEFPERLLRRATFASVTSLEAALGKLKQDAAA